MFIERLEHHLPPPPPHGVIVDTRSDIITITRLLAPPFLYISHNFRVGIFDFELIQPAELLGLSRSWSRGWVQWVMLKGEAGRSWKIWLTFTIWLVFQTQDLHFSKYQTTLSIKKFSRFRHSTAVGRDRSNMLQKGLGMLTTVINLHFICSFQVSAFLITVTQFYLVGWV